MGDIDILVCEYCEEKISRLSKLLPKIYTENMSATMCLNIIHCKTCCYTYVSANYYMMIIVSSKNYTISIIGKENITINRQNQLLVHP